MIVTEQINRKLQKLPPPFQQEVLDFVDFLLQKSAQAAISEGKSLTPEEKAQAFESWANSHALDTPVVLDDSREIIYEDA